MQLYPRFAQSKHSAVRAGAAGRESVHGFTVESVYELQKSQHCDKTVPYNLQHIITVCAETWQSYSQALFFIFYDLPLNCF